MHIVQTPVRFLPDTGGVESYVYDLSTKLRERGHTVSVVCAESTKKGSVPDEVDRIRVERVPSIGKIANTDITPTLPLILGGMVKDADVFHTHIPTPWSADITAIIGAVTNTPVVVTYHNDVVGSGVFNYIADIYNRTQLQVTLRLADRILTTHGSYVEKSEHLEKFSEKTKSVTNGVNTEIYYPKKLSKQERKKQTEMNGGTIFFLSVLDGYHGYKGLDTLLNSIAILKRSGGEAPRLIVGGEGQMKQAYEEMAANLGIADLVSFEGYIDSDDLRETYSAADAFVLPSKSAEQEGFGLVLLEALSCGTPVITTPVVGVADFVSDHDAGTLVPPEDPDALADAIYHQVHDRETDRQMLHSLCEEQYSWMQSARQIEDVYRELVAEE